MFENARRGSGAAQKKTRKGLKTQGKFPLHFLGGYRILKA